MIFVSKWDSYSLSLSGERESCWTTCWYLPPLRILGHPDLQPAWWRCHPKAQSAPTGSGSWFRQDLQVQGNMRWKSVIFCEIPHLRWISMAWIAAGHESQRCGTSECHGVKFNPVPMITGGRKNALRGGVISAASRTPLAMSEQKHQQRTQTQLATSSFE